MNALIIANGTLPGESFVQSLVRRADQIICADGGANHARKLKITPDIILGDLDSITLSTKKYYHSVRILHIKDQYSTDLEKAIQYCIDNKFGSVDIVGATGSRIDHTTGGLGCFRKFGKKITLRMHDTDGTITRIDNNVRLRTKVSEKISLIPLERCTGITTRNLKYSLKNESLELGIREGISNFATEKDVSISVKKGTLLLYIFHK